MWWRLARSEYNRRKGDGNRAAMKGIVDSGEVPGILAYRGDEPVAWCSVAPRESFPVLARSRTLKPVDGQPVWSIVCLFVRREYRRQGMSVRMIEAAARYVKSRGGRLLEAYPIEPGRSKVPDAFIWTGVTPAYARAGFIECAQPSKTRRIVRRRV